MVFGITMVPFLSTRVIIMLVVITPNKIVGERVNHGVHCALCSICGLEGTNLIMTKM